MSSGRKWISFLDEDSLIKIDEASLRLLDKTGLAVHDPELRALLARAGARVDDDQKMVHLPPEMVQEALAQAPRRFEVAGRDGNGQRLVFPAPDTYQMSRGKMPMMLDYEHRETHPPLLQEVTDLLRLNQALPAVDCVYMVDCSTADVSAATNWLATAQAAYLNTLKPLVIAPIHRESAEVWVEMGEAAMAVPMLSVPTAIVTISTTSLQLDADSAQALTYCVRKGLPLLTLPIPMAGAVAPFTLAGTLLTQNVEVLFLLTAAQVIRPGAPVIYGGIGHVMNMRYGRISFGSPELPLCNAGIVALARHYDLPGYNATGYTDSALPDFQSGAEKMLSIYTTLLSGADIALVGTLDNSASTSPEIVVMDHDLWEAAARATREVEVNEDTLAEELVAQVGPGGNYMGEEHTRRWLRSGEHYYGGTFNREGGLDDAKTMLARARTKARELIVQPSVVPEAMADRIRAYVQDRLPTTTP